MNNDQKAIEKKVITSVQECIDTIKYINENPNIDIKYSKYLIYVATGFFTKNKESFSDEQVDFIFSNSAVEAAIAGTDMKDILKFAIEKNKLLPIKNSRWFRKSKNMVKENLLKYLKLIDINNDEEQLALFIKECKDLTLLYYRSTENKSDMLHKGVLSIYPDYVKYNKKIPENIVIDLLTKEKIKPFEFKNIYNIFSAKTKDKICELFISYLLKHKERLLENKVWNLDKETNNENNLFYKEIVDSLCTLDLHFYEKINNQEQQFISDLLSIKLTCLDKSFEKYERRFSYTMISKIELNLLQEVFLTKLEKNSSSKTIEYLYDSFTKKVRVPLTEFIGIYGKDIELSEYALKKEISDFFLNSAFLYNKFSDKEKEIYLTAAFEMFSDPELNNSAINYIFEQSNLELFDKYYSRILPQVDYNIGKKLNIIQMNKKLNESISVKDTLSKKIKI